MSWSLAAPEVCFKEPTGLTPSSPSPLFIHLHEAGTLCVALDVLGLTL